MSNFEIRLINPTEVEYEIVVSVGSENYLISIEKNSNEIYTLQNFKFEGKTTLKIKCDKNIKVVDFRIY